MRTTRNALRVLLFIAANAALAQTPPASMAPQNPSPMTESTRRHERLTERALDGTSRTFAGPAGRPVDLRVPPNPRESFHLVIHFHGAAWLAQQAIAHADPRAVGAVLNLGGGSSAYQRPFADTAAFDSLLAAVEREVVSVTSRPARAGRITLVGFSAGYGAVRAILRDPRLAERVNAVLLLDGLHTSYMPDGTPLASGGVLDTLGLVPFARFARAAARSPKRFVITHSEIFPGTYASTTESADWLISAVGARRSAVLKWGPRGMQQLSEARIGGLEILGFAGNAAPDHIDQLHAMPELLKRLVR